LQKTIIVIYYQQKQHLVELANFDKESEHENKE